MNVLSLFDGMSCGRVALERCGFEINRYYAAEIDKYAMNVAANNYPDTVHIGDVTKVFAKDLEPIDLLIGGSPCQGFSFAGKQLNFEDPRSMLFFEFVRLLKECKPKYFFLENVVMKKEYQDVISKYLGVEPIMLNSSLVSAQSRKRLYWTNIQGYTPPEDKGILLKDIVHEHTDFIDVLTPNFNINPSGKGLNGNVRSVNHSKSNCLTTNKGEGQKISVPTSVVYTDKSQTLLATMYKGNVKSMVQRGKKGYLINVPLSEFIVPFDKTLQILDKEVARGKVGYFRKDSQANRVYYIHDKAVTLCDHRFLFGEIKREVHQVAEAKESHGQQPYMQNRVYNVDGIAPALTQVCDRLNVAIPCDPDYLFGCITPDRVGKRQNSQRFNDGTKFYTLTAQDRHGILIEGYIRKLSPIECERLQTLPDNYTAGASNSQRYKMLGNGWTVDAVCEFFKHIPKDIDLF